MQGKGTAVSTRKTKADDVLNITADEVLAELFPESERVQTPQPGDFTVQDAMRSTGLGYDQTSKKLRAMSESGALLKIKVNRNGRAAHVYRKASPQ